MKVRSFYRPGAVCATPEESLRDAARKMRRGALSCLPVLDGDRVVGIITERDLVDSVANGVAPGVARVMDYMNDDGPFVGLDDDSAETQMKMLAIGCRHLPVVEGGKIVGMVSIGDLVRHSSESQTFEIRMLTDYIHGKYPG